MVSVAKEEGLSAGRVRSVVYDTVRKNSPVAYKMALANSNLSRDTADLTQLRLHASRICHDIEHGY